MEVSNKSVVSLAQSSSTDPLFASNESISELTDFSVDEIFSKYSVAQVQRLQLEYKSNVAQAKDDLHRLVGEKYRDLIRIAEDIEGMSAVSRIVDTQLSDLSYKSSNYVSFGSNPLTKFDSLLRHAKAKSARSRSGKTILNNVINNKLIGLDLKLKTNMLKKSSTLVFMAKLYYTIGVTFKDTLLQSPHVSTNLLILKKNFVDHLEHKIATARTGSESLLAESEIFHSKPKLRQDDENEFDIYDDAYGDDEQEEFSDSEESEYFLPFASKFNSSSPIVNYIIAYIIVNRDNKKLNSLEKIAEKIVSLRRLYLEKCLARALESVKAPGETKVDFIPIFSYIETTCLLTDKYFLSPEAASNDVLKQLKSITNWNASDLIGFHNWFEEELISFRDIDCSLPIPRTAIEQELSQFGSIAYNFSERCLNKFNNQIDSYQSSERALHLFQKFIGGLRRTEVLCLANSPTCFTVQYFAKDDVTSRLLDFIQKQIVEVQIESHLGQLNLADENSIVQLVKREIEGTSFRGDIIHEPFTQDVFDLMDDNMNYYIKSVVQLSSLNKHSTGESKNISSEAALRNWFSKSLSLLRLLSPAEDSIPKKIHSLLGREFKEVNGLSSSWGTFTKVHLQDVFSTLQETVLKSVIGQTSIFATVVDKLVQTYLHLEDSGHMMFLLRILLVLKENAKLISDSTIVPSIDQNISEICNTLFASLLSSPISGKKLFAEYIRDGSLLVSDFDSATLPVRPHLGLNSAVYGIVQKLLDCSHFNRYEMCSMYLNDSLTENFVAAKNEWIMNNVIAAMLESALDHGKADEKVPDHAELASAIPIPTALPEPVGESADPGDISVDETKAGETGTEEDQWSEGEDDWANEDGWDEQNVNTNKSAGEEITKHDDKENEEDVADEEVAQEGVDAKSVTNSLPILSHKPSKLLTQQSRQCLANIVFMLNFVTDGVSEKHEQVAVAAAKLNRESSGGVEGSVVEYIVRNVNEFYKTSRQMFLPLLAH